MLDKLVESKNNTLENRRLRGLLFVTSTIAFGGLVFALVFSLFAQSLAMANSGIELSTLIAPPVIPEVEPKPPEPKQQSKKTPDKKTKNDVPTRRVNIMRLDESPSKVPSKISTDPSANKARPNSAYKIGNLDRDPEGIASNNYGEERKGTEIGTGLGSEKPREIVQEPETIKPVKTTPPPPPKPKPVETPNKEIVVSGGVINGKAKNLVTPRYSAAARGAGVRGQVSVQVLIDENGKVITATAVSGPALLRRDAVIAARRSSFTPTYLSKQKVKVRGVILYNFN